MVYFVGQHEFQFIDPQGFNNCSSDYEGAIWIQSESYLSLYHKLEMEQTPYYCRVFLNTSDTFNKVTFRQGFKIRIQFLNLKPNQTLTVKYNGSVEKIATSGIYETVPFQQFKLDDNANLNSVSMIVNPVKYFKSESIWKKPTVDLDSLEFRYNVQISKDLEQSLFQGFLIQYEFAEWVEVYTLYPDTIAMGLSQIGGIISVLQIGIIVRLLHKRRFEKDFEYTSETNSSVQLGDTEASQSLIGQQKQEQQIVTYKENFTFEKLIEMSKQLEKHEKLIQDLKHEKELQQKVINQQRDQINSLLKKFS